MVTPLKGKPLCEVMVCECHITMAAMAAAALFLQALLFSVLRVLCEWGMKAHVSTLPVQLWKRI